MSAVGSYLRNLRGQQGVSLEELARATRVLYRHLEALEADDLAALPAPVFTKGFIRAYCQVLGVAPDEALALYDPRSNEGRPAAPAPLPSPTAAPRVHTAAAKPPRTRRGHGAVLVSLALLVVLGVALFAFAVAFKSGQETGVGQRSPVASAPPPSTEASPEPSPVVEPPAPTSPAWVFRNRREALFRLRRALPRGTQAVAGIPVGRSGRRAGDRSSDRRRAARGAGGAADRRRPRCHDRRRFHQPGARRNDVRNGHRRAPAEAALPPLPRRHAGAGRSAAQPRSPSRRHSAAGRERLREDDDGGQAG